MHLRYRYLFSFVFLLLFHLAPLSELTAQTYSAATCTGGRCIVNAGQDQVICPDGELFLRGEDNEDFATPLNAFWTAAADNPAALTLANPNALVTEVSAPDGDFPVGVYNFTLTITCDDGSVSCNETSVTVVELPDVQLIVPEMPECSSSVFLARSGPLPEGVTDILTLANPNTATVEEREGGFLVSDPSLCTQRFSYTLFAGTSCRTIQTGVFEIHEPLRFTSLRAFDVSCENDRIEGYVVPLSNGRFCVESDIQVLESPGDVDPDEVVFTDRGGLGRYNFSAPAGRYVFELSLTNACGTATRTIEVECPPDLGVCGRIPESFVPTHRVICGQITNATVLELPFRQYEDASYTVESVRSPSWMEVTTEVEGSSGVANIEITGTPDENDVTIFITVRIQDTRHPECPPVRQRVRIVTFPDINGRDESLNFNCGAGNVLRLPRFVNPRRVTRFTVFEHPEGYTGSTQGRVGNESSNLQLDPIGTYRISFIASASRFDDHLGEIVRCESFDTLTVIVDDIPTIDAGSDAVTCEETIRLNGSTPRNATGNEVDIEILWEPIEDYPGVVISDPTIRNPLVSGLEQGREYTFRYAFPGSPDCQKEDFVTISAKEECEDEEDPLTCDIDLRVRCTTCGCGDPLFIAEVRNSNGNRFAPGSYEIKWFVDGEPLDGQNLDNISAHYEGPGVVSVIIAFGLGDGKTCELERSAAVTCGGDCPLVSFDYSTDDCEKDYFYGEVTVVDQAGNPVTTAGIDWYADGATDPNPYLAFVLPGESIPVVVDFYSPTRCVREVKFEPECSSVGSGTEVEDPKSLHAPAQTANVFPNPARKDQPITIGFDDLTPAALAVTDLSGREVFRTVLHGGTDRYTLSPANLPPGVFAALLYDAEGAVLSARRFIVR